MKFTELNQSFDCYTIRGQFESDDFNNPKYNQELFMLSELEQRTINNVREQDPDITWTCAFNHLDGHDGRFPIMAKMRDWWGLSKRQSGTWLMTKRLGNTSTFHTDDDCEHRYLIFLTEWQPGQVWFFDTDIYTGWHIGTVVDFNFQTPHGNANASHEPFTFMQITTK